MAYDSLRDRLVMFGGRGADFSGLAETWEWDGSVWMNRTPAVSPPASVWSQLCYDVFRNVSVLRTEVEDAVWEWDGNAWRRVTAALGPGQRLGAALAYDSLHRQTLLFGGQQSSSLLSDLWAWNGTTWSPLAPSQSGPSARSGAALAFDDARGRLVLFGGFGPTGTLGDTWEWNGNHWTQLAASPAPSPRGTALAYDSRRQRTVLFGGTNMNPSVAAYGDTWEWDGTAWQQRSPSSNPDAVGYHALAFDTARGLVQLFGGKSDVVGGIGPISQFWSWDGTQWSDGSERPELRTPPYLTNDDANGAALLFGYGVLDDERQTWERIGQRWMRRHPANPGPESVQYASLTYDPRRGRGVLVMEDFPSLAAEAWEWDGATWTHAAPSQKPTLFTGGHAVGYDEARQRVVLFTGFNSQKTWEWDGATWTLKPTQGAPTSVGVLNMAFDQERQALAFLDGNLNLWMWDGVAWQATTTTNKPPARASAQLAYDRLRQRLVVSGGYGTGPGGGTLFRYDAWELQGTTWVATQPAGFSSGPVAYQPGTQRLVAYGIEANSAAQTWELVTPFAASFAPYGAGCAGSTGPLSLAASGTSLPWTGSTFHVRAAGLSPALSGLSLLVGASSQQWGPLLLPAPLGAAGGVGCSLLASGEIVVPFVASSSAVDVNLPIPALAALAGGFFYQQVVALDNGIARFLTSNGGRSAVGVR